MDALDDAVDKYRGYGVRLQFYYQSVSQLRKCFPDGQDQTLLSNVSQVFFGINDLPTAEYVSNRLGEQTIVVSSGGTEHRNVAAKSGKGEGSSYQLLDECDRQLGAAWAKAAQAGRSAGVWISGSPSPSRRECRPSGRHRCGTSRNAICGVRQGSGERFTAMANVFSGSLILLLVMAGFLVMVCSGKWRGRAAATATAGPR